MLLEKKNEDFFSTKEITLPIHVVVRKLNRTYTFTNPTVFLRSGTKGKTVVYECVITSKPDLSYTLLSEGTAASVAGAGAGVSNSWKASAGKSWKASVGKSWRAGTLKGGERSKQKRNRRSTKKVRKSHHRTK